MPTVCILSCRSLVQSVRSARRCTLMFGGNFSDGYLADRREEPTRVGIGSGRVGHRLPRRPIIERRGAPVKSIGRPPAELAAVMVHDCTTLWAIARTPPQTFLVIYTSLFTKQVAQNNKTHKYRKLKKNSGNLTTRRELNCP